VSDERRHFQRLSLSQPLDGWFGDYSVRLIDVSMSGAQIESEESLPIDARALLRFYWRGHEVEVMAETVRNADSRSGLHFTEESETLGRLITDSATEMLRALEANARGDREANVVGEETITSAWRRPASGFIRWTHRDGEWESAKSDGPDQPDDGFTVAASEPREQVLTLCRMYESGDAETRRTIRMLAELSVVAGT
jgi:hypothetical protein